MAAHTSWVSRWCFARTARTSRGATVWGAWALNSKQLVSPIPVFWGVGLSYEGLIRGERTMLFQGA